MGLFDFVGDAASWAGGAVSDVTSTGWNEVTHPENWVGDYLNAGLYLYHGAAQGVGLVGDVTGSGALQDVGKVDREVFMSAHDDPVNSGKILGGATLTALSLGTGSAAGAGLIASGAAGIAGDVIERENAGSVSTASSSVSPAPSSSPSGTKMAPNDSFWNAFRKTGGTSGRGTSAIKTGSASASPPPPPGYGTTGLRATAFPRRK